MKIQALMLSFVIASFTISCEKTNQKNIQKISIEQNTDKNSTWKHLEEIQKIADQNQNRRNVGSSGGIATADYIVNQLKSYGLEATKLPFETEGKGGKKVKGQNITVEIPGKSKDIIILGAHYDSVEYGPGMNDNATGVAILLEVVSTIKKHKLQPEKTLRIAFWDAEEEGALGSAYYTKNLSEAEKKSISSYINVDMVGTKDPDILVLDGDGNSLEKMREDLKKKSVLSNEEIDKFIDGLKDSLPKLKEGSSDLEKIVENYLKSKNIKYKDELLISLSSDTSSFIQISPITGLAMTHDVEKPDGKSLYAPCYHEACDDINNVDKNSFYIALGVISHLVDKLAFNQ